MAKNASIWCPRGDWYACQFGTFFAGCCGTDPCRTDCPLDALYPVEYNPAIYGMFPDMFCPSGGNFYTCGGQSNNFFGCCVTNPCTQGARCPDSDLRPASMDRPEQINLFGDPSVNNIFQPPINISSVSRATAPALIDKQTLFTKNMKRPGALAQSNIPIGIIVAIYTTLVLWLCYRRLTNYRHRVKSAKYMSLSLGKSESDEDRTQATYTKQQSPQQKNDIQRIGLKTLWILGVTGIIILALCGFLAFLWFGDARIRVWKEIMAGGWATRSVSVAALVLRTTVDIQAAIATAILGALLLESNTGVHLSQIASISPTRAGTTNPWTFASYTIEEYWRSTAKYRRNYAVYVLAAALLLTTSIIQFSSTILLSDLKLGPLVGQDLISEVRPGPSYLGRVERIPRDSAWITNPPFYPAFGEYHEPVPRVQRGVADTGMLLRTFLPYSTAESRQSLSSYAGKALVLDARVSCQAPLLTNINATSSSVWNGQIRGVVAPSRDAPMLQNITATPFECAVAGKDEMTICQVAQSRDFFMGSLNSQFDNSSTFGTTFIVIGSSNKTTGEEWSSISIMGRNKTAQISLSLCFAPWDAAILDVSLDSRFNRTEPLLQFWQSYQTADVLKHLLSASRMGSRQVLDTQKPQSFLGDLPPRYRRPIVQSDMGGSSAAAKGTNIPLPGNWTVFMTGSPLITILRSFEDPPTQAVAADPALAAIFTSVLDGGSTVEWALSSLITVLSMTNYYSQQPAFDRVDKVSVSFFNNVLYPRGYIGFTCVMWGLVAHFFIVAALVVLFVMKTRLTLLGNVWSTFSQVAESGAVRDHMTGASLRTDIEVMENLKNANSQNLRARLVSKEEGAEVMVAE